MVTAKLARILWTTIFLAACSKGGGGGAAGTPRPPDPTPTPAPWAIDVTGVEYSTKARVGGTITVTATIENTGTAKNPAIEFQFSDIDDYADLVGCKPKCTTHEAFGDIYAVVPGIAAGTAKTIEIEFLPTEIGAAHWSVCIFDDELGGELVSCWDATTTIR